MTAPSEERTSETGTRLPWVRAGASRVRDDESWRWEQSGHGVCQCSTLIWRVGARPLKSYFLIDVADPTALEAALGHMLPGQSQPWLLLSDQGDPIAYFNVEHRHHVQVDLSGRHCDEDEAVLKVLEALRTRVGGTIHNDQYPKQWAVLKYPGQRADLLDHLKTAENPSLFSDSTELEFLVHFVFDDHDFRPAATQRGLTLLNDSEEEVIQAFVAALDRAIGPRTKALTDVSELDWRPVAEAARLARAELLKRGEPWSEPWLGGRV